MNNNSNAVVLPALTSARFFAALMIVFYHIPAFMPAWTNFGWVPKTFVQGVSFFFVLSGFILTHVYASRPVKKYGRFIFQRYARLWPVHFFTLLIALGYFPPGQPYQESGFQQSWIQLANTSLLQSILPYNAYVFSGNQPSWSISTEMYFYFAFPFLMVNIQENWRKKLLLSLLLVCAIVVWAHFSSIPLTGKPTEATFATVLYASPLTRLFEFTLGMSTWVIWEKYVRHYKLFIWHWSFIELSVVGLLFAWLFWLSDPVLSLIPSAAARQFLGAAGAFWLFAPLVAVLAVGKGCVSKVLKFRFIVYLGNISFSLYLIHQLTLKLFLVWLPAYVATPWLYAGTTLFMAAACHSVVEMPAQRFLLRAADWMKVINRPRIT